LCSSPVEKSIGGETDVLSGKIHTWYTSLSVLPDAVLPLILAKCSLVTSYNCLVVSPSTLKKTHLFGKFIIAEVLIKKSTPRIAEVCSCGETRNT
jgi:hypothetical protein